MDVEYIVWLITARCNLNCKHCYAKTYLGERELSRDEKIALARQLGEYGVSHVCISGGEPLLLREELISIVKILRDYDVHVSMVTNGTLLREDLISRLISMEVFLHVSLDGDKRSHEMLRGEGTWRKTVSFLEYLHSRKAPFGTVMAISRLNYGSVDRYVNLAARFDPETISLIPVMPYGKARETEVYVSTGELREAIRLLERAVEEHSLTVNMWCLPCLRAYTSSNRIRAGRCRGRRIVDISPGGNLLLCDVTGIVVCRWCPNARLSDLVTEYFSSSVVVEAHSRLPQECVSCSLIEQCRGGCYARSFQKYSRFDVKDPLCPL